MVQNLGECRREFFGCVAFEVEEVIGVPNVGHFAVVRFPMEGIERKQATGGFREIVDGDKVDVEAEDRWPEIGKGIVGEDIFAPYIRLKLSGKIWLINTTL